MKRNTVKPLHNGDLGDRRKWPLWRGGRYGRVGGNMAIFSGEYDMFITLSSCLPSPRMLLSFSTLTYSAQFLNVRHNN